MTARTLLIGAGLAAVAMGVGVALNSGAPDGAKSSAAMGGASVGSSDAGSASSSAAQTARVPVTTPQVAAPASESASAIAAVLPAGSVPTAALTAPTHPTASATTQALLREAQSSQRFAYRLSETVAPPPFDVAAYRADPQRYLEEPAPGRVFQSLPAGRGVPALGLAGPGRFAAVQGQGVTLAVRVHAGVDAGSSAGADAVVGAAVCFFTNDGGVFSNGLSTQTVAADADGIARVTYTATPGVSHFVNILAGSPMASGQVALLVDVADPGLVGSAGPSGPAAAANP